MDEVSRHYTRASLAEKIEAGFAEQGIARADLTTEHLSKIDELHIGGIEATRRIAAKLTLDEKDHVLDVGCGIGGPARYFAQELNCNVTGIDLTAGFIDTARTLTDWVGLGDKVSFKQANALNTGLNDQSFDTAYMFHVGMNIEAKEALIAEVARILRKGATFAIYDVMQIGPGEIAFPVPWASAPAMSFVAQPARYKAALEASAFTLEEETVRQDFAIGFFEDAMEKRLSAGQEPLGPRLFMGEDARQKFLNIYEAVKNGIAAPVELIAKKAA